MPASKVAIPALRKRLSPEKSSSTGDASTSPASNVSKPKRTRASAPRVRTGCQTCKMRHVKCDEARPSCKACTFTGRKCDGYATAKAKGNVPQIVPTNQPLVNTVTSLFECRAFDHFCNYSAPILSSFFDSHFWMKLVLQMSSANAAVKHAVVALDTLSERLSSKDTAQLDSYRSIKRQNEDWRNDRFAIAQYNKALESLRQDGESRASPDIFMVVCVLFICVEALRGDIATAIMHFNGGMTTAMAQISRSSSKIAAEPAKRMEHEILLSLCRIELLSLLFGNGPSWPYPIELGEAVPHEFADLKAARDSMVHIVNITMRFLRQVGNPRYSRSLTHQDYTRQFELKQALSNWSSKFAYTVANLPASQEDTAAAQMLRMHHSIAYIMVSRSTEISEYAADAFLPEFQKALELAEGLQGWFQHHSRKRASTFMLEMEIVSPTYYIAAKCRHPQIRRRAIALLKTLHRREGFFDSDLAAALATRIMNIEEANLAVLDGSEWPREETRVHNTDIKAAFEVEGPKYTVTFLLKPDGVDRPWQVLEEDIDAR